MKRVIVIALLVGMTSVASARAVRIPQLSDLCPSNAEWDKLATCVKRHAPFTLLRDEAGLKLLFIEGSHRHFGGYHLYTYDKQWKLHGHVSVYGAADLLQFERVTFGRLSGYRIDIGTATASAISLDGETSIAATYRHRMTSLCVGGGYCTQLITECDVFVHGRAYFMFRGKLVHENHMIKVKGDRSRAGQYCMQDENVLTDN